MQAVLYVGHGSRVREARKQAAAFTQACMEEIPVPIQELCFLELAEPDIHEGIRRCVERGADYIAVLPLLLLTAGHAKRDIPAELEKARRQFSEVTIQFGRPFGVHEIIVDILIERMREKVETPNDAHVLLVGRGSSDPDTKRDMERIAELLKEKHPLQTVQVAYLAAAKPTFEEGLERMRGKSGETIFVVPYLLFTGILMNEMRQKITGMESADPHFVLCDPLGYHPNLMQVVRTRVGEVVVKGRGNGNEPLSVDGRSLP